jgi:hypothetical protein
MGRARCLSDVACGLTAIFCCAGRSWILVRREDVPEANGAFSALIREGYRLRERSGRRRLTPLGQLVELGSGLRLGWLPDARE